MTRFNYGPQLPAQAPERPLEDGPLEPELQARRPAHPPSCGCLTCWNMGIEVGIYLANRKLFNDNGY